MILSWLLQLNGTGLWEHLSPGRFSTVRRFLLLLRGLTLDTPLHFLGVNAVCHPSLRTSHNLVCSPGCLCTRQARARRALFVLGRFPRTHHCSCVRSQSSVAHRACFSGQLCNKWSLHPPPSWAPVNTLYEASVLPEARSAIHATNRGCSM
jgi:hypothetical protein